MTRKEEIIQVLKHLLSEVDRNIDGNQFSDSPSTIAYSCNRVLEVVDTLKGYMKELNEINLR